MTSLGVVLLRQTSFAKSSSSTQLAYDALYLHLKRLSRIDTTKRSWHEQKERSYPESNRGRPEEDQVTSREVVLIRTGSDNRYTIKPYCL